MSDATLKDAVTAAVSRVVDSVIGKDLGTLGMVQGVEVKDGKVSFTLEHVTPAHPARKDLEAAAEKAARAVAGVKDVSMRVAAAVRANPLLEGTPFGKGVKHIIAVGSGKGGVGKSTVSANLACALSLEGARVGLMDLDVWGPNIPLMMGAPKGVPPAVSADKKIVPHTLHGVKVMSVGFFVQDDEPIIWRGPMVNGLIKQFTSDVDWGDTDYLLIDLPPGTGDVQLSMTQNMPLTGAVVVSTPQDVALLDVGKSIAMFQKVSVPILGIVENMSYFVCPSCTARHEIFHHGGAKRAAEKWNHPFLGAVPIDLEIRVGGDTGTPIVVKNPKSPQADAFRAIGRSLAGNVARLTLATPAKPGIMDRFKAAFTGGKPKGQPAFDV